jgi:hypothetical protein
MCKSLRLPIPILRFLNPIDLAGDNCLNLTCPANHSTAKAGAGRGSRTSQGTEYRRILSPLPVFISAVNPHVYRRDAKLPSSDREVR